MSNTTGLPGWEFCPACQTYLPKQHQTTWWCDGARPVTKAYDSGQRLRDLLNMQPIQFQADEDSPGLYLRFRNRAERAAVMEMLGCPDDEIEKHEPQTD